MCRKEIPVLLLTLLCCARLARGQWNSPCSVTSRELTCTPGDVVSLNLQDDGIATIGASAFLGLSRLTSLSLNSNPILSIHNDTFAPLTMLETLGLGDINIGSLPRNIFAHQGNLVFLDLEDNADLLHPGIFDSLTQLAALYLRSMRVSTLSPGLFRNLGALEYLYMDDSSIRTLDRGTFSGLTKLQMLDLQRNSITSIGAGVFRSLVKLKSLSLRTTHLKTVMPDAFSGLGSLTSLDLALNSIAALPSGVFNGLSSLRSMDLSGNDVTAILDGAFNGLTALNSLDLYGNDVTAILDGAFNGLTALNSLCLLKNSLTFVGSYALRQATALQSLSLESNGLLSIDNHMFKDLASLQILELARNSITSIASGAFADLFALETIELNNNDFDVLSASVLSYSRNLKIITMFSIPRLTAIEHDAWLPGLRGLRRVDLRDNALKSIGPDLFVNASSVSYLGLQNNELRSLSDRQFAGMRSLNTLWLSGNYLTQLSTRQFEDNNELQNLLLDNNRLLSLPDNQFQDVPNLLVLELHSNQLTSLSDDQFQYCTKLQVLWFGNNQLTTLHPTLFSGLRRLHNINATHNFITNVLASGVFETNTHLRTLDLSSNQISTDLTDQLASLTDVETLRLSNNPMAISGVPFGSSIKVMHQLKELDLATIGLSQLPEDFFGSTKSYLTRLNLAGNGIRHFNQAGLQSQTLLRTLFINDNPLTTLPQPIEMLTRLYTLDLANVGLSTVPALLLKSLSNLNSVNLASNQLSIIPEDLFAPMTWLRTLRLDDNKISHLPDTDNEHVFGNRLSFDSIAVNMAGNPGYGVCPSAVPNPNLRFYEGIVGAKFCSIGSPSPTPTPSGSPTSTPRLVPSSTPGPCSDVTCSNGGQCKLGRCMCSGYAGDTCQYRCPSDGSLQPCSGHGICTTNKAGSAAECQCRRGWTGNDCSRSMIPNAQQPCDGVPCVHGLCLAGTCSCSPGWGGTACDDLVTTQQHVYEWTVKPVPGATCTPRCGTGAARSVQVGCRKVDMKTGWGEDVNTVACTLNSGKAQPSALMPCPVVPCGVRLHTATVTFRFDMDFDSVTASARQLSAVREQIIADLTGVMPSSTVWYLTIDAPLRRGSVIADVTVRRPEAGSGSEGTASSDPLLALRELSADSSSAMYTTGSLLPLLSNAQVSAMTTETLDVSTGAGTGGGGPTAGGDGDGNGGSSSTGAVVGVIVSVVVLALIGIAVWHVHERKKTAAAQGGTSKKDFSVGNPVHANNPLQRENPIHSAHGAVAPALARQ